MNKRLVSICDNFIQGGFYALFLITPLLVCPWTYELFEFPKMMFVYIISAIIGTAVIVKMQGTEDTQPRVGYKNLLALAILGYLGTFVISTIFSVHPYTSIFGYYGRFHGGLLSLVSYGLLFFVYIFEGSVKSEMVFVTVRLLVISALVVSIYGVLQHYGIDNSYWIQDSSARVFSTFGQPNWLAAWLVMVLPVAWFFFFSSEGVLLNIFYLVLSILLFTSFWFTYSLSGFLGFGVSLIVIVARVFRKLGRMAKVKLAFLGILYGLVVVIFPGVFLIRVQNAWESISFKVSHSALAADETPSRGRGDTAAIRKLVWEGSLGLWRSSPKIMAIGSGPETFAYAFVPYRPLELNKTSEWDFLYNKAHNEYLDILCEQGALGLLAYIALLGTFICVQFKSTKSETVTLSDFVVSGWLGFLVTNFFGFTVVPTAILFWLFPAGCVASGNQ